MPNRQIRTVKQTAWIEAMLTGVTPTEAAEIAKYSPKTWKQAGHKNMTKAYLMAEIDKRRTEIQAKTGMTVAEVQGMYKEDREFAKTVNQAGACVSATTGIARLYGMDKDAGKPPIAVVNVISYAGSAGVKPPKQVESEVIDDNVDGQG